MYVAMQQLCVNHGQATGSLIYVKTVAYTRK